ncbi:hypothetical protein D9758_009623 [Tetrapyrgos nigripes]|uniref:Uncharacterized protein n=1 Tax=Tetrapyrgos nigripes TaxID=182062 RepID=A0A8H5GCV1_9AGAR|nr:hypothetical protein D9758_009623 [Tetrapyrgos nigripes]
MNTCTRDVSGFVVTLHSIDLHRCGCCDKCHNRRRFGDPTTGLLIDYTPAHPNEDPNDTFWKNQNQCTPQACAIRPSVDEAFDKTWTQTTYFPNFANMSIGFNFEGSALYLYFIVTNVPLNTSLNRPCFDPDSAPKSSAGTIAGSVVGTIIGLLVVVFALLLLRNRRRSSSRNGILAEDRAIRPRSFPLDSSSTYSKASKVSKGAEAGSSWGSGSQVSTSELGAVNE